MALDILEMFYRTSGYTSDSSFAGSDEFIAELDVTGSYIPGAEAFFEKLVDRTVTISANSSGDLCDDMILAELSALMADFHLSRAPIDPTTGEPENQHWKTATLYILQAYGVLMKDGSIVMPGHAKIRSGMDQLVRVVNSLDNVNLTT